jgi:hypothetical protein
VTPAPVASTAPLSSALVIAIKKKTDGSASLACRRAGGTVTWQRQEGAQGRFFPRHDLTHYAVETVLGMDQAFYGLVASGWEFGDFGHPWPRGPMPVQAIAAELIVGYLDAERAAGTTWTAGEFNAKAAAYHGAGDESPGFELGEADLERIRQARAALFARWDALAPGDTLELPFPLGGR